MNEKLQRIQRRSFECWRIYGKRKLSRRRSTHKAVYSYSVRLEQKVINSLLKNCIEAKVTRPFYENLATKSKRNTTVVAALTDFNRKNILKQAYRAWYEHLKHRRRIKDFKARICNIRNQLYNKYIVTWKINCLEKKENVELDKKASVFYRNFLQRKSLRLWIDRHNDNLLQMKKWYDAVMHSRLKLLKKFWFAWIRYCNSKIERANKNADARYLYDSQLLRKSLRKLTSNATKKIAEKSILERATNRYEKILLLKVLRCWINHHRRTIDLDRKIEMRYKRMENTVKEKILWQLRLYVWKKKCSRRRNYNSTNHYKRKIKEKTIFILKNYLLYRKEKAIRLLYLNSAITRISYEMNKMYIDRWRIAVICNAQERQKLRRVEEHSSAHLTKHYFSIWKEYSERYKVEAKRKKILCRIGETVLLNKYITLWMTKIDVAAIIHEKENRAISIFEEKLKIRHLNHWKRYIEKRKIEIIEIDEAKKFHRKHLLREGLKKALKICLYKSESRYENRLKSVKTNCFEDFEIMRKYFGKWWEAFANGNENRKTKTSTTRSKESGNVYEIPYASSLTHRLVLPEYMRRNTSNLYNNCGFYQQGDFSSHKTELSLPSDSSSSDSYKSINLSSGTYNITEQDHFTQK